MRSISDIDAIIFDFDGVLTDNYVYVNSEGKEYVKCSRSDGLAFDALKILGVKTLILSTESNTVVEARARKLGVSVIQNIKNKLDSLKNFCCENDILLDRICYVGNDINDVNVMRACGMSLCPADSHPLVKKTANLVMKKKGGNAVVRELVEFIFKIDIHHVLYGEQGES